MAVGGDKLAHSKHEFVGLLIEHWEKMETDKKPRSIHMDSELFTTWMRIYATNNGINSFLRHHMSLLRMVERKSLALFEPGRLERWVCRLRDASAGQ